MADRCQQNLRLEIPGARGWSQKGGKYQWTHLTDTQATVFYGKLACNHCVSESLVLVMRLSADLKCPSNKSRAGLSTEGAHRKRCWSLGALKETRSSSKASWPLGTKQRKSSTARFRSSQRANQVLSKTFPGNSGAPSRVTSATLTKVNDDMVWSTIFGSGLLLLLLLLYYYSARDRGRSIVLSMSVCLSAIISLEPHVRSSPNFCACKLRPWLGTLLAALRYVMYFRFYGWRHIWTLCAGVSQKLFTPWRFLKISPQRLGICNKNFDLSSPVFVHVRPRLAPPLAALQYVTYVRLIFTKTHTYSDWIVASSPRRIRELSH